MPFVTTEPTLAASANKLRPLGPVVAGNAAAAAFTAGVALAGTDDMWVRMATQFTAQAEMLRAIRVEAPAILRQLAEVLSAGPDPHAVARAAHPDTARRGAGT